MSTRKRLRRGFTLLEVMVYAVLLGIMMTAMYLLLRTTLGFMRETNATASLQASAQRTAVKIAAELAQAHKGVGNIVASTSPSGIVFLSPRPGSGSTMYDSAGNQLWRQWVCYYFDAQKGRIMRSEINLSTPTTTPPSCPYTVLNFTGLPGNKMVADKVTGFSVALSGGATVVDLTASFSETVNSDNDYELQVTNQVLLRN